MSDSILERLDAHLRDELGVHRDLLTIAEAKRDDIVTGDIAAFSRSLAREQEAMTRAQELGRVRARLLEACARHLETPIDRLRMAQIMERAPEPLRGQLSGVQRDLRAVLERLREVNERNMVLIRQSLSFLREVMHIITGDEVQRQDYGRDGGDRPARGGGAILDSSC